MTPAWDDTPVFGSPPVDTPAVVRPSAYGVVIDAGVSIAVVHTPLGLFLPGGGMEQGETPRATVVREVLEECGLSVRVGGWSVRAVDFVYSATELTHFEKRNTFVDAHPFGLRIAAKEPDHELEWVPVKVAAASLAHPSHRWAVEQWLEHVLLA